MKYENLIIFLLVISVALSVVVALILWLLRSFQPYQLVLIPIVIFLMLTTAVACAFTGIISFYFILSIISLITGGTLYFVFPALSSALIPFLPFLAIIIIFPFIPLIVAIYIWIKIYLIMRGR